MQAPLLTNQNTSYYSPLRDVEGRVNSLDNGATSEVLAFLEKRSFHTAYLAGLIRDNGLQSPLNRGTFYGYRNRFNELEGIALIGHATLMETASDQALEAFARRAQQSKSLHLIMCEENRIEKFWEFYAGSGQEIRRACRELLFELRWPNDAPRRVVNLRLATIEDLDLLVPVQAEMAFGESGVDPREQDPTGFLQRYVRRIEQGRTWVLVEDGKLIFKVEVVAETPSTSCIEGVWVNPEFRGLGYGRRCMSQLARMLLWRTKSICLFVNDENEAAQKFYKQIGYHRRCAYDTIFLK